jgi:predicted enzyme related to lactoylglutathione lyase
MLSNAMIVASIPVVDLEQAKQFYSQVVGLKLAEAPDPSVAIFEGGGGTRLLVYARPTPTMADHTAAAFFADDVEAAVDDLIAKGVVFERYDMPGMTMDERGVASMGPGKIAWFKDPGGNILSING